MTYTDQSLTCRDCGQAFTFTAGEQEFYASRGLQHAPSRCPECRAARRSNGGHSASATSSSGQGYEPRSRAPREMHEARCDSCGGVARVPFVPRGDKPVYCSDCFNQMRAARY